MTKNVLHKWTQICQDSFDLLKNTLLRVLFLNTLTPRSRTLFTNGSKYVWACILTQAYDHVIEGKERTILHPITYVSGYFEVVSSIGPLLLKKLKLSICLSRNYCST